MIPQAIEAIGKIPISFQKKSIILILQHSFKAKSSQTFMQETDTKIQEYQKHGVRISTMTSEDFIMARLAEENTMLC